MTVRSKIHALISAFLKNQYGGMGVMAAAMMVVLIAMAGFAIDYTRLSREQAELQSIADAAAVAAAAELNKDPSADFKRAARELKKGNQEQIGALKFEATHDSTARSVKVVLTAKKKNYFGAFLGRDVSTVIATSVANYGKLPAIEIAIAFDVTGSMKYIGNGDSDETVAYPKPGSKAEQAKKGLKKFLKKLENLTDVKVALVPFATVVKIHADSTRYQSWLDWSAGSVASVSQTAWEGCIVDREVNIAPFVSQHSAKYPATTCKKDRWDAVRWTGSTANDVSSFTTVGAIEHRINALQFDGCTNITLGAYWGGVLLDPSGPLAGASNWNERKKILLLISDGMNTTDRWTSIPNAGECARKTSMDPLTIKTCDAIKEKGIDIYTVNVVNGDPHVLKACANDSDHYFYSTSAAKIVDDLDAVLDAIRKQSIVTVVK